MNAGFEDALRLVLPLHSPVPSSSHRLPTTSSFFLFPSSFFLTLPRPLFTPLHLLVHFLFVHIISASLFLPSLLLHLLTTCRRMSCLRSEGGTSSLPSLTCPRSSFLLAGGWYSYPRTCSNPLRPRHCPPPPPSRSLTPLLLLSSSTPVLFSSCSPPALLPSSCTPSSHTSWQVQASIQNHKEMQSKTNSKLFIMKKASESTQPCSCTLILSLHHLPFPNPLQPSSPGPLKVPYPREVKLTMMNRRWIGCLKTSFRESGFRYTPWYRLLPSPHP